VSTSLAACSNQPPTHLQVQDGWQEGRLSARQLGQDGVGQLVDVGDALCLQALHVHLADARDCLQDAVLGDAS
jgi:hypothetical protein